MLTPLPAKPGCEGLCQRRKINMIAAVYTVPPQATCLLEPKPHPADHAVVSCCSSDGTGGQ